MRVLHRALAAWVAVLLGSGCATLPEPSSASERQSSPGAVTRDNPGGDAAQPVDAALERLLDEPLGLHVDYWRTLAVPFPDQPHWKGTRFKRYPTRAAFQYGREYIGIAVVAYTKAAESSAPAACMAPVLKEMRAAAEAYGIDLGATHREVRTHPGGAESVDWVAASRAATDKANKKRRAPAKKRPPRDERRRRVHALRAAQPFADVPLPDALPDGEMLVVRTSGRFNTLFKRDEYVGAVVAYESWPGTCLLQGFAVRVGSDVMLARRVVTRWVEDAAPNLRWAEWLREAPPLESR